MATRYVHAKKGKKTGSFTSKQEPARRLRDAIAAAAPGDTVEILDTATYREGELIIDKPITIVSSHFVANPGADPTIPKFDEKLLPAITTKSKAFERVLRIVGSPATRSTADQVTVRGVRIVGGQPRHTESDPALGAGGGIAIIDYDKVLIEKCIIAHNRTTMRAMDPWPESDRLAFRSAILDLVSTLFSPTVAAFINKLTNPTPPLTTAAVVAKFGKEFDDKISPGRPNSWLAGQSFGGGIATVWASCIVRRCVIRENVAQGRGAGAAVVGYGWPTFDSCLIEKNKSGDVGRRDGGGIGCEVALPGKLTRNLSEVELIRFLTPRVAAITSKISASITSLTLADWLAFGKWLANPSGPSTVLRGLEVVILYAIHGRWKEAKEHLTYFVVSSILARNRWDAWNEREIKEAQKREVNVLGCMISKNHCGDDGGGFYSSVLSRVIMSETFITENQADEHGGGVRLTMGSAGKLVTCTLLGNTALVLEKNVDPKDRKAVAGGGGLSVRNSDLELIHTRIGPVKPGLSKDSNVTTDHAGGGIAFQSESEGPLVGMADLWTAIMVEVFEVRALKFVIRRGCRIEHNAAGYVRGPKGIPKRIAKVEKAKGGGIWMIQVTFADAPRLDALIEEVIASVQQNDGQINYPSRVMKPARIHSSKEVCIQDLINLREWTESNFVPLLKHGDLKFRA